MTRNPYDEQVAEGYRTAREIPRDGLVEWREAVRRHLRPTPGMVVVDVGAGTGQFASAFTDWFGIDVVAVEPSAAMRERIPVGIDAREGNAGELPFPDASVDGAWISLVLHHIPDLEAAARELRRVVRSGAPVLIRGGMSRASYDGIENVRWFPETARTIDTYPSVDQVCAAFGAAGFRRDALEEVRETRPESLADFLAEVDTLRYADTTLRALTDDEFLRGKERLRRAVDAAHTEVRSNWLDLLVLR